MNLHKHPEKAKGRPKHSSFWACCFRKYFELYYLWGNNKLKICFTYIYRHLTIKYSFMQYLAEKPLDCDTKLLIVYLASCFFDHQIFPVTRLGKGCIFQKRKNGCCCWQEKISIPITLHQTQTMLIQKHVKIIKEKYRKLLCN